MSVPDLVSLARTAPVHFLGIGGAGMCALAELVARMGGHVSGCDLKQSPAARWLEALGADVRTGHSADHVDGAAALVISAAIPDDHPEVERARELGVPVVKRAAAVGAIANQGRVVAVAGTHGKTTTTAMAAEVLAAAGMNPTALVGGTVAGWKGNLRYGGGSLYVVEADEYDRSFHSLEPDVAVVTNVEADHLDVYGDLAGVEDGFRIFLGGLRPGGRVVVCADDHGAARLLAGVGAGGYSYGLSAGSKLRAIDVRSSRTGTSCRVMEDGADAGPLALSVPGLHNLRNALGAAAAARYLGAEWDAIGDGLAAFRGVARRFQGLGEAGGVVVVDDYAHHPTEIRATLSTLRTIHAERRLVAVFQPHLYSRTRDFHREFGAALAEADLVWVTDVFPARERPIPGVTGELIVTAARDEGAEQVQYQREITELTGAVAESLRPGDVVVTLGAGSIEEIGPAVLTRLRESAAMQEHRA